MKADFWRYAIVWKYGGVYSDVDVACSRPIQDWGHDSKCEVVLALENSAHICQWTFASRKGHPLFGLALELIVNSTLNDGGVSSRVGQVGDDFAFVHHYTGPGVFTRALLALLLQRGSAEAIAAYRMVQGVPDFWIAHRLLHESGATAHRQSRWARKPQRRMGNFGDPFLECSSGAIKGW
jgi:hypothetical protein